MSKLLRKALGCCRVWSSKLACFWYRQWLVTPAPEIKSLYNTAHKFHLIFYWVRLPGEVCLSEEGDKFIKEQILGPKDFGFS